MRTKVMNTSQKFYENPFTKHRYMTGEIGVDGWITVGRKAEQTTREQNASRHLLMVAEACKYRNITHRI